MKRPFCGRTQELDALRQAYRNVAWAPQGTPQLVAIVGESGLGKTRLVQEFYRWLATSEDGSTGYWPGDLAAVDDNLQINPDPAACNSARPVPFLWWGLRLPDPGARNQAVAGQLASSLDTLTPHLEPALRTERRRQAGKGMAMAVGNVAFDVAFDFVATLVPPLGLLKTIGQGALELGQHARTLWRARDVDAPGRLQDQQREDLADRIVSDFGVLLSRDATETPAVPAVIVIDDGQFSEHDPSIVTFVQKMMTAAVARQWRVLFVVTYWTAEWNRHFGPGTEDDAPTIARVIHARRGDFGEAWRPLDLPAVGDLSPIVAAVLPGLPPAQTSALVERAGGNPRYLDEVLRFCERNERLFVGRNLSAPLTDKGLATLLERTVDLQELVAERLHLLEPGVRRALLLASAQGQEFLTPLVSDVSAILHETAGEPELDRAEHPHAFIHRQPGCRGAFAQRVFHEVAVAQIGNDFDEDAVQEALRAALRRRLDAFDALMESEEAVRIRTCLLASELLVDTADDEDAERVRLALVHLVQTYQWRQDHELAWRCADRLSACLADANTGRTSGYPYHVAAATLMARGRVAEATALLARGLDAQRQLVARNPSGDHEAVLALLLETASRCARAEGRAVDAEVHLREALDIRRTAVARDSAPDVRRSLLVTCLDLGHLARDRGDLQAAGAAYGEAHAIAKDLDAAHATCQSGDDLVLAQVALGDVASALGDVERAAAHYAGSLARVAADGPVADGDTDADARRAGILERIGRTALSRGDLEAADRSLQDAVALRRRLAERLQTPEAHAALANGLRQVGDMHWDRQDLPAAWTAFAESLAAIEAAGTLGPTPFMLRVRSLALERMGRVALLLDDLDTAEAVFGQRLDTDRAVASALRTVDAWRNVLTSEFWLADVAEQRGDPAAAEARFRLTLDLARDLLEHQRTASAKDDVRRILARLGRLVLARGDEAAAAALQAEAAGLEEIES